MFAKPFFVATLAAAAVLASAASAHAGPAAQSAADPGIASQAVFVGDLNLSSQAGASIALRRIQTAAAVVCGEPPDVRELDRTGYFRACIHDAVDRAVTDLDSPVVAALHAPRARDVLASSR
jgi:UrcA family protein